MTVNNYEKINEVVNRVFLDGRYQSLSVYLDLEDDASTELASELSVDPDELEQLIGSCVASSLKFNQNNIYSWHKDKLEQWFNNSYTDTPPPFTALLLTLSLAAERMRQGENYSANNYYHRLCEVLGLSDEEYKGKISAAGKYTLIFWKALNLWLTDNDYAYGRPTAKPVIKSWSYVSYAISQSLVRDADRKRLHKMFDEYGLSAYDKLGESEIMLYLHEWMAGNSPSVWLKKLWAISDLRERIAAAAINELETWDESAEDDNGEKILDKHMGWLAVLKSFPKFKASIFLSTSTSGGRVKGELMLANDSSDLARRAFEDADHIWLTPLNGTEMVCLEPIAKMKLDAILMTPVQLVSNTHEVHLRHDPRPIIPLVQADSNAFYREVARVTLHVKHVILCHKNWIDKVTEFLKSYARPGFNTIEGNGNNGLPIQWCLLTKVEVLSIPSEIVNDNLQCLVPLAEGVSIQLLGGLKLASGIWHAAAAPEVFASDADGMLSVKLKIEDLSSKRKILLEENESSYNPAFLRSTKQILAGKNLLIEAGRNGKIMADKNISFRSAITPRKLIPERDHQLVYSLDEDQDAGWGFSAIPIDESKSPKICLEGMIFESNIPLQNLVNVQLTDHEILNAPPDSEEEQHEYNLESIEGAAESCILRGYHIWQCEPYEGPGTSTSRVMECKDCHAIQVASKKRRAKKKQQAPDKIKSNWMTKATPAAMSEDLTETISADTVYDALCYIGAGTWNNLETVLSSHVELPWQVHEFARNLVDLGLIDMQLNDVKTRPHYWSCPPPCVVINENGLAYLSGFRNTSLLTEIKNTMERFTKRFSVKKQDMAPILFQWDLGEDFDLEELEGSCWEILDPFERLLNVVRAPGFEIVLSMPSASDMTNWIKPIHVDEKGNVERFDLYTGRWAQSKIEGTGAYRIVYGGRRYFFHDKNGNSYEASHELVKLLAAREAGIYLHRFDKNKHNFECVIGCSPPGLYRRALVSCSGILPTLQGGKLIYNDIPEELANILMYKMYE